MLSILPYFNKTLYFIIALFITQIGYAKPTILVLGDSLSDAYLMPEESGWVSLLADKLKKEYPQAIVLNRSIVGDTTANGLERLPETLANAKPDIVIVELGGNDGLRGLPIDKIRENLKKIIELCIAKQAKVVLVGIRLPPNYSGPYGDAFNKLYPEIAKEFQLPFVPFLLEGVALSSSLMQADRIHPTANAQPLLLNNVWPVLAPLLENS